MGKTNTKSGEKLLKEKTREQILDAAEELFSEKGFSNTSIRDITEKANCNIASVNYHFHGKKNLYISVFRRRMNLLAEQRVDRLEKKFCEEDFQMNLESLIYSFVEIFLEPFVKDGSGNNLMRLMIHERYDPHLPKGLFLNEVIQPVRNTMSHALIMVCPELNRVDADLCLHSIVAQLLNLLQAQDLFKRLNEKQMPLLNMEKSINHIVKFSIGGISRYLKKNAKGKGGLSTF